MDATETQQKQIEHRIESMYYCTDCNKYSNINSQNMIICRECGKESDQIIDHSAEWHNFSSESNVKFTDPTRCGSVNDPLLYSAASSGTTIGYTTDPEYIKMRQVMQWKAMTPQDRSKKDVYLILETHGKQYGIAQNVIERSKQLFSEVIEIHQNLKSSASRGNFREGLVAVCTMRACEAFGIPMFKSDAAKLYGIDESDITRANDLFSKTMLNSQDSSEYAYKKSDKQYYNCVDKYCSLLGINNNNGAIDTIKRCLNIIEKENLLTKNKPQCILCGCIFFCSVMLNLGVDKNQIKLKCGPSQATINKIYKILINHTSLFV